MPRWRSRVRVSSTAPFAGVTQWQSSSLPSWLRGFDSHHPLQTACGSSSVGRAPPCQGGGRESESRLPLQSASVRVTDAFFAPALRQKARGLAGAGAPPGPRSPSRLFAFRSRRGLPWRAPVRLLRVPPALRCARHRPVPLPRRAGGGNTKTVMARSKPAPPPMRGRGFCSMAAKA